MKFPKSELLGYAKGPDGKWYGREFYGENEGAAVITGPSPEPHEGMNEVREVHREPAVDAEDARRKLDAWQRAAGWPTHFATAMSQLVYDEDKHKHILDGEPVDAGDVLFMATGLVGTIPVVYEWSGRLGDLPTFRPPIPIRHPESGWGSPIAVDLAHAKFCRAGRRAV